MEDKQIIGGCLDVDNTRYSDVTICLPRSALMSREREYNSTNCGITERFVSEIGQININNFVSDTCEMEVAVTYKHRQVISI